MPLDKSLDLFVHHSLTDEQREEFLRFNRRSCYIVLCLPILAFLFFQFIV